MSRLIEIDAEGGFRVDTVPARSLELRVGTAEELEAGSPRATRSLVFVAGETTHVAIDL
jgi:hypothetical protein